MKHAYTSAFTALALSLMVVSCGNGGSKSSSSSGSTSAAFRMTGSAQLPTVAHSNWDRLMNQIIPKAWALTPPALVDSQNSTVTLTDAWIVVKEIEFKTTETESENEDTEIQFRGPFYVDLLSDSPVSFGDVTVPAQGFRRIQMKLHEADSLPSGAPGSLNGNSLYFNGTVDGVAFSFESDDSTEIKIAGPNALVPTTNSEILLAIRVADLFKKIDMSAISSATMISSSNRVATANPCPLIDNSANDLYTCFRKGLESESDLGCDDSGDHDLDENEETEDSEND